MGWFRHGVPGGGGGGGGGGSIPVNTALPTIYGTPQVGQVLTASNGTWTNSPTSYAYQWQREGFTISGATSSTYTAQTADLASVITVKVIATNSAGAGLPAIGYLASLVNIMPLGDSITQGFNSPGGYRAPLWSALQTDGYNIAYVGSASGNPVSSLPYSNHEGHGGFVIAQIQDGIDNSNWLGVNPDVILLQVGVNDFFGGRTTAQANTDYGVLLDDILARLPNVKVICGSLVQFNSWVDTFNAGLPALVASKGSRVSFVDLRAVLTSGDLFDGTHPSQTGYNKLAPVWETGVKAIVPVITGPVISTTVFYVSSSTGLDTNAGTRSAPWQTLTKVNASSYSAGTSILFKRGDVWRNGSNAGTGRLKVKSGTSGNPLHYDAYGSGPNPTILGSVAASSTGDWINISGNIWKSNRTFSLIGGNGNGLPYDNANEVGSVTWGTYPNRSYGVMVALPGQSDASLTTQGQWLFNTTDLKVHIFSVGNPATAMPSLELGVDASIVEMTGFNYVTVQNFMLLNGAGHGINYSACTGLVIRDNIIGWIGGGNLGGSGTRYGNGTQAASNTVNTLVERNFVFECYDGGITQESATASVVMTNLTYRNNVIYNCTASLMEVALNGAGSIMDSIFVYNNTAANPGGWSKIGRPGGNGGWGLDVGNGAAPTTAFNVTNNSFSRTSGVPLAVPNATWGQGIVAFDYNNWQKVMFSDPSSQIPTSVHLRSPSSDPTLTSWAVGYTPDQEIHGLIDIDPQLVDYTMGDVSPNNLAPAVGSPLLGAGTNLFSSGVVWDFYKRPRPTSGTFTIGAFEKVGQAGLVGQGIYIGLDVVIGSMPLGG